MRGEVIDNQSIMISQFKKCNRIPVANWNTGRTDSVGLRKTLGGWQVLTEALLPEMLVAVIKIGVDTTCADE